jgi:hypothetical protein
VIKHLSPLEWTADRINLALDSVLLIKWLANRCQE